VLALLLAAASAQSAFPAAPFGGGGGGGGAPPPPYNNGSAPSASPGARQGSGPSFPAAPVGGGGAPPTSTRSSFPAATAAPSYSAVPAASAAPAVPGEALAVGGVVCLASGRRRPRWPKGARLEAAGRRNLPPTLHCCDAGQRRMRV